MDWLDRIRSVAGGRPEQEEPEDPGPTPVVRAAPGIEELFRGLREDGSHAVLDLGSSEAARFRLYGRFARKIRFAELVPTPPRGAEWTTALRSLRPPSRQLFDVVLLWNVLDLLAPGERRSLIEKLTGLTSPGARLYAIVDSIEEPTIQPLRFTLLDLERVSQEPVGRPTEAPHRLLPAEVERLLKPFEVVRAYTLRMGLREYVTVKGGKGS